MALNFMDVEMFNNECHLNIEITKVNNEISQIILKDNYKKFYTN
jgi:hypothetical protein